MGRLPEIGDEPEDARVARVWDRFAREGRRPIALYRALANAPHVLEPYSALTQALRHHGVTSRELRELCILRIAHLTGSEYEWAHHRKLAADVGLPDEKVRAAAGPERGDPLSDGERVALRLADEVHAGTVSDETMTRMAEHFSDAEVAELVMVVAIYVAVARLIQALGIAVEDAYQPYIGVP
jgi:alkylhydroperoxidase family enzyme